MSCVHRVNLTASKADGGDGRGVEVLIFQPVSTPPIGSDNCLAAGMPLDNVDFRMACDVASANEQCRVCRSAKVTVAFSTVQAVYWTCQSCEATWSEPRAATSAAFRISKIVESRRPAHRS